MSHKAIDLSLYSSLLPSVQFSFITNIGNEKLNGFSYKFKGLQSPITIS